ncbi:MAG: arsenosugar biosynthesis radical SAM protein ArsS, partial [Cyclobacteriaceae bacterium]
MSVLQSLKKRNHAFKEESAQIDLLSDHESLGIPSFKAKLERIDLFPLKPTGIDIFQVNVGKMCNQVCKHCHVDAGPDRKEIMTRETMQQCLDAIQNTDIKTVDLTGGAPEMNPDFRWFVEQITAMGKSVIVRCNLTIILANPKYHDLPEFFKKHKVNVVSSLPYFTAKRTDAQRGDGVFEKSIKALKMLNEVGYGDPKTGLQLDLVYNPTGAFLPGSQEDLETEFRTRLQNKYDIAFNSLFAITNIPVSRFLEYLVNSNNYEDYMNELVNAFNPAAALGVMCRNTISIGWDGYLFDCDFNQMLDLKVQNTHTHVSQFDFEALTKREIVINQHCFG